MAGEIKIVISPDVSEDARAKELLGKFEVGSEGESLYLKYDIDGLSLCRGDMSLKGDFSRLVPRAKKGLHSELLVRAAKIKDAEPPLLAIDATAGLGEDSFFLAAAGFEVILFEKNCVIYELLDDAVKRAALIPGLDKIVARMRVVKGDSIEEMGKLSATPDVVLLDPMFPERQKTALVKKKLQIIQALESPCGDERELFVAAVKTAPKKLIIKRPPKGAFLAGIKPDHSIEGKAVRFDCFVLPMARGNKLFG